MDTEERPSKLRKLETHVQDTPNSQPSAALLPRSTEHAPSDPENSKPQKHAADDADANGSDSCTNSDVELSIKEQAKDQDPLTKDGEDGAKPMSKNQLKKQRKRDQWEAGRDYRKAKRKQKIQERRQRKRDAREEERVQQENGGASATTALTTKQPLPRRRPVLLPITIMIDCGFDDLMMEKERISLGSQLTRSYSDNWRAPFQTHLVISSWGGLLEERFNTVLRKYHLNWKGVTFEKEGFVDAAQKAHEFMRGPKGGKLLGIFKPAEAEPEGTNGSEARQPSTDKVQPHPSTTPGATDPSSTTSTTSGNLDSAQLQAPPPTPPEQSPTSTAPSPDSGEIIYLSSDSPDTLSTLRPYSTYIVGGLVDKNRHKGICYRTACERGIKTAKLPIGEYLEMQSRKVLTTNHVVEIMIRYLECGDWGEAFLKVIPKRKGGKLRGHGDGKDAGDGHDDGEDVDDDEDDEYGALADDDAGHAMSEHIEGVSSSANAEVSVMDEK
ncbi:hypothetical protein LTR84_007719 [Exophiala bonariae]|uniref:tRNA (guanine(9)-N1)-methyltransferase n=1 Tax=Exophiala bonariae TaxID=1690606 RepID=A0AAV9NLA5_9EURO|nr:hypothetical protein LTR84_007719 [Exophiala bonariae]